ncbi:MAG: LuxR C-terminal-related transcriptional regulator, partial [Candidatus Eisenbacteria bacterium]
DVRRAARCAIWLVFQLQGRGDRAQAGGWLARARRLLENCDEDCVERGYLMLPEAIVSVHTGDTERAYAAFVEAGNIGARFADRDLMAMALNGQGRALIRRGEPGRGVALLDEAMIAVTSGEVSPVYAGGVYCSLLEGCEELLDVRRATEWTAALDQWCAAQPDLVPYRGHCLLRRAEILQLHGAWADALEEAGRARERLSQPEPRAPVGGAFYRIAELHRLRGDFAAAEEAYRVASRWERLPHPGLALLRLAQGQTAAALTTIRGVADEVRDAGRRARALDALVEIALAAGEVPAAQDAADELAVIAARLDAPWPRALAAQVSGAVRLAGGDARGALDPLRTAWGLWRELEAPYEAARVRVSIALACRIQGDHEAADLELEAALGVFQSLGAAPDAARVETLARPTPARDTGPLTAREVQVLSLVASGMTNREIAGRLGISEKTVARHLSNIFIKLDLPSRAAATAYAYRHDLV